MDVLIAKNQEILINEYSVTITAYLGQFATGVDYFAVKLKTPESEENCEQNALLRIGSVEGALDRELTLREAIGDYKLIGELITHHIEESLNTDLQSFQTEETQTVLSPNNSDSEETESDEDYLEEEYYEEKPLAEDSSPKKHLVITSLPPEEETLEFWLKQEHTLETLWESTVKFANVPAIFINRDGVSLTFLRN